MLNAVSWSSRQRQRRRRRPCSSCHSLSDLIDRSQINESFLLSFTHLLDQTLTIKNEVAVGCRTAESPAGPSATDSQTLPPLQCAGQAKAGEIFRPKPSPEALRPKGRKIPPDPHKAPIDEPPKRDAAGSRRGSAPQMTQMNRCSIRHDFRRLYKRNFCIPQFLRNCRI